MPAHPGLAWSEGWASYFSGVIRGERYYYDKQDGLFFWIDYDSRSTSGGSSWLVPQAEWGLDQMMDENEVTRMLLALTTTDGPDLEMLAALASKRMTAPPFARGYRTRVWDGLNEQGLPLPYQQTDRSAPFLADYLDALVCAGAVSPDVVDEVTQPWSQYPYPSDAPLCDAAEAPIRVSFDPVAPSRPGEPVTVTARIRWVLARPLTLEVALVAPPDVAVTAGDPATALTLDPGSGERALTWRLRSPSGLRGVGLSVRGDAGAWAVAGRVPVEPPPVQAPRRDGPEVWLRGQRLGRAIRLH